MTKVRSQVTIVAAAVAACAAISLVAVDPAVGYDQYNDGCQNCHGSFTGATSPIGTIFPNGDKHTMHRSSSYMNTECDLCHTSGGQFDDPFIGSSNGTVNNPGLGCTGCHNAEGLRLHHANNSITTCAICHPNDAAPPPESAMPPYYGTVDTNADRPCNDLMVSNSGENWSIGDFLGVDNDGDNVYDSNDPDCQASCTGDINGDGSVGFADLNVILAQWGACPGCSGDLDGDGNVGFSDLNTALGAWGPC